MLFLTKVPFEYGRFPRTVPTILVALLLSLLNSQARAADRAYYSTGDSVSVPSGSSRVELATKAQAAGLTLTASVQAPSLLSLGLLGPIVTVRLPLNGVAPAGYRAGVLITTNNATALLNTRVLETVTLRTYLRNTVRETQPVNGSVLKLALLAAAGQPRQLEFTTSLSFDRVEVSFDPGTLSLSLLGYPTTNILYAYGIAPGVPKQVTGYLSQFGSSASTLYNMANSTNLPVAVCVNNTVVDPQNAVDNSLTNYAYFNTLAGVGCTSTLRVTLAGTVPGQGYRAGFVVGNAGLLDVGLLNGLRLRTFLDGVEQEASAGGNLLKVQLLSDDKAFVSFAATKPFNGVSIERTSAVALVNNLRLYYGFGLSEDSFTTNPIVTSFPLSDGRYTSTQGSTVCAGCGSNVGTASDGPYIRLSQGITLGGTNSVRFELTGPGLAGNRAGIVLGQNTALDLSALDNVVLTTYDASGAVLETATSSNLLALSLLPDNRREVSFRTTRDFAQVGISINRTLAIATDVNVYSAFADDLGLLQLLLPPTTPLPVVLTSFTVSRAAGSTAADVAWVTASEQHSARFVVERATNPQAGFVAVGEVAAAGTSTTAHRYSLHDATAPTRATSYYRLRQVDTDGRETLSPVVALAATEVGAGFALYPNPAPAGAVTLSLDVSAANEGAVVLIYSPVGQVLRQQAVRVSAEQPTTVSTAGLPTGIYHVVLRNAAGQALGTQRLVVNN